MQQQAAAASSSSTKPIQLKRKDQVAGTGEPVTVRDRVRFDQESTTTHVESDSVKCDPASTGQPVARNDHLDPASTERPLARDVGIITHKIDLRIQGLPHSSVEEAEHVRILIGSKTFPTKMNYKQI